MADQNVPTPEDDTDVEAHSVLEAQGLDEGAEVEAHSCCSTISTSEV